ncbi:MAG: hypothetical protein BWY11_01558 [Firmicutes bacterium ADurb.Bin182]|nr:MAG: hypothetical protein BWY11_01558 [Firmicutes bacterium ADurb.Bin182]
MAKPQELRIPGYDFFFWPYEEQTKMKHKVLVEYFKVWATKLGKYSVINFFDCHGGCGAYLDADKPCWGSSILVARTAQELYESQGRNIRNVRIFVAEIDHDNCENLTKVIEHCNPVCWPQVVEMAFEDAVMLDKKLYQEVPSLFFIDPFGFRLNYSVLRKIRCNQRNELLINFMFDYVNRFLGLPELAGNFDTLFGCRDWREAISLDGSEREQKIIEIFRGQLKLLGKYVFPYKVSFYDKDRTYYYLFHVIDHYDGCSIMKSCFASLNNGKVEYLGNRSDRITLFDLDEFKIDDAKDYLMKRFSGQNLTFAGVNELIIEDTMYPEKDIRKALQSLKAEGKIQTFPVTSKTARGLSGDDVIVFAEAII